MALFPARIGKMTIPNGANASNVFTAQDMYGDAIEIIIGGPAALPETIVAQASFDPENIFSDAVQWYPLKDINGTAISVPAANEARIYSIVFQAAMGVRFVVAAAGTVAADRTWVWSKAAVSHGLVTD